MSTKHDNFAKTNPKPYKGSVTDPRTAQAEGVTCSIQEAANYLDIPELIERYGDWAICSDGIYSLYIKYFIDKNRFDENDWVDHLSEKNWVNIDDFTKAFSRAKVLL